MRIIGIDPGKSGGIAVLDVLKDGFQIATPMANSMPDTERDCYDLLKQRVDEHCERSIVAVIEKVHAMPKQGVTSMFTFGQNYGFLRGCVIALKIPLVTVTPAAWQKALGLNGKFASPKDRKNAHKARAQELFPSVGRITHATADALLIAESHRRMGLKMEKPEKPENRESRESNELF